LQRSKGLWLTRVSAARCAPERIRPGAWQQPRLLGNLRGITTWIQNVLHRDRVTASLQVRTPFPSRNSISFACRSRSIDRRSTSISVAVDQVHHLLQERSSSPPSSSPCSLSLREPVACCTGLSRPDPMYCAGTCLVVRRPSMWVSNDHSAL
jgi:hypothetical protein